MEINRRSFGIEVSRSHHLQRSRSIAPAISPASNPDAASAARTSCTSRPKSSTRNRVNDHDENRNPRIQEVSKKSDIFHSFIKPQENQERRTGVSPRRRVSDSAATMARQRKVRSATTSPSAWALSPGRSPAIVIPAVEYLDLGEIKQKQKQNQKQKSGGMSGVLRFFRQQKTTAAQKEASHQIRVLHTSYMQWRFANARAEAAMVARKSSAQKKIFSAWLTVSQVRNSIVEKRLRVQKLKQEVKLLRTLSAEIPYLKEWEKVDKRNLEGVTKLARSMRAISLKVPFVSGAKADIISVYRALSLAMDVTNRLEATISKKFIQVEEMNLLMSELVNTISQERESIQELFQMVSVVASLEVQERSLRISLIQGRKERLRGIPLYMLLNENVGP